MTSLLKKLMAGVLLAFVCADLRVAAEGWKVEHTLSAIDEDCDGATFQLELTVSWDSESVHEKTGEAFGQLNIGEFVGDAGVTCTVNFENDRVFDHYGSLVAGDDAEMEFALQRLSILSALPGSVRSISFKGLYVFGEQEMFALKSMLEGHELLRCISYNQCMLREFVSGSAQDVVIGESDFCMFEPAESVRDITFTRNAFSSAGRRIIDDVIKIRETAEPMLVRFGLQDSVFARVDFQALLEHGVEFHGAKHVPQLANARWRAENPFPPVPEAEQRVQPHRVAVQIPGVPAGVEIDPTTWADMDSQTRAAILSSLQGDVAEHEREEQLRKAEELRACTLGDHAGWRVHLRLMEAESDDQVPTIYCALSRGCFAGGSSSQFSSESVFASTGDRAIAEEIARMAGGKEYVVLINTQDAALLLYNQVAGLPADQQEEFFRNRWGIFASLPEGLNAVAFEDSVVLSPREIEIIEQALACRASFGQVFYSSGCFHRPMAFGQRAYTAHVHNKAFFCSYNGELSSEAVKLVVDPAHPEVPETIADLFTVTLMHEVYADVNLSAIFEAFGIAPATHCLDVVHVGKHRQDALGGLVSPTVRGRNGDGEDGIPPLDLFGAVQEPPVSHALQLQAPRMQVDGVGATARQNRLLGAVPGCTLSPVRAKISFEGDLPFRQYSHILSKHLDKEWHCENRFSRFGLLPKKTTDLVFDNLIALMPDEIVFLEKGLALLTNLRSITFSNCALLRPIKSPAEKVIFENTVVCQPFGEDYKPNVEWLGPVCDLDGKKVLSAFIPFMQQKNELQLARALPYILEYFGITSFLTRAGVGGNQSGVSSDAAIPADQFRFGRKLAGTRRLASSRGPSNLTNTGTIPLPPSSSSGPRSASLCRAAAAAALGQEMRDDAVGAPGMRRGTVTSGGADEDSEWSFRGWDDDPEVSAIE